MKKIFLYIYLSLPVLLIVFHVGIVTPRLNQSEEEILELEERLALVQEDQELKDSAVQDLADLVNNYDSVYNLCEQKVSHLIDGNYTDALVTKGQIDSILTNIDTITEKYNFKRDIYNYNAEQL